MSHRRRTRVKICCIASVEEAALAIRYGADALGLVSPMPSGPGCISLEQARDIRRRIPPPISAFLLTCSQEVRQIDEQLRLTGCDTVQICDELTRGSYQDLREGLPLVSIVQVIHVTGVESIEQARRVAGKADAILLDSGRPSLAVKELGGTGRVHDWALSRQIVEACPVPVFLAGGLKPENAAEAIRTVSPFALDVCSGVRSAGRLDESRLSEFMRAVSDAGSA